MMQLTLSRAVGGDLVATNEPPAGSGVWLEAASEPDASWRYTYAPQSADIAGNTLLQAVKEHSSLPFSLYLRGTSAADLATLKATWTDALEQWSYTATLLVDGEGFTWTCDPTSPSWGEVDSGMASAFMARASVVIPVYPIGVAS